MKKLNSFLNILMGSFFGVFVGNTMANYREYRAFPEIYEVRSAPWYTYGALQGLILFLAVAALCIIVKIMIRNKKD